MARHAIGLLRWRRGRGEGRPSSRPVLRERSSEILASWIVRFERSPLRFRRATKAATHTAQVANLRRGADRGRARRRASTLQPGSDATRELERSAAFLGAQFASEGATGFDVAALLLELRDVVAGMVVARRRTRADAPVRVADRRRARRVRDRRACSRCASRPASSSRAARRSSSCCRRCRRCCSSVRRRASVLDNLLARAWMLAVGTGAPCLIIDCGGLAEAGERNFETRLPRLSRAGRRQRAAGPARRARAGRCASVAAKLTAEAGLAFQHFDRLDSAVAHALERAGHLLMRRS